MSVGRITKNAGAVFVGRIASSLLGFFSTMLLARLLDVSELGIIGIAISTITLLCILPDLGLGQASIYLIPRFLEKKSKGKVKALINYILKTKTILAAVLSVALFLSADVLAALYQEPMLGPVFRIFSLFIVFFVIFYGFGDLFVAFQKMFYVMYSNVAYSILKFLLIVMFFVSGFIGVVYGYFLLYLVSFLFAMILFFKIYPKREKTGKIDKSELISVSKGMFFMTLTYTLVAQISNILLGLLNNPVEVAYFNISTTIGILVFFTAGAFGSAMRPAITEMDSKESRNMVKRITKYMLYTTLPITSLAIGLGTPIIRFIYTEKYLPALPAYNWVILAYCLNGIFYCFYTIALSLNKSASISKTYIIRAVLLVGIGIFLIPSMGAVGAGIAFLLSTLTSNILLTVDITRIKKIKIDYPLRALIISLISFALMFIPIQLLWNVTYGIFKLILLGTTSMAVYLTAVYALGGLDSEDINLIKRFFSIVLRRDG